MIKLFWQKLLEQTSQLGIEEPALPWKRKAPKRIKVGSSEGVSPASPENHYKMINFEVLDTVIACVKSICDWAWENRSYLLVKFDLIM